METKLSIEDLEIIENIFYRYATEEVTEELSKEEEKVLNKITNILEEHREHFNNSNKPNRRRKKVDISSSWECPSNYTMEQRYYFYK